MRDYVSTKEMRELNERTSQMTKKDFKLIAKVLGRFSQIPDQKIFWLLVQEFINELHKTNPKFNSTKFRAACVAGEHQLD